MEEALGLEEASASEGGSQGSAASRAPLLLRIWLLQLEMIQLDARVAALEKVLSLETQDPNAAPRGHPPSAASDALSVLERSIVRLERWIAIVDAAIAATSTASSSPGTCEGVQVVPGSNIQALIDANPPRTTFCFASGRYLLSGTIRTGDRFPVLDLRAGAIIDGQNGHFVGIDGPDGPAGQPGTVLLGGVFQHFGNVNAPIWISAVIVRRNGVVVGTEFRENFNTGLSIAGDNARVSDVYTHHNGKYGMVVTQPCAGCGAPTGVLIEDSEIAFNNTRRSRQMATRAGRSSPRGPTG